MPTCIPKLDVFYSTTVRGRGWALKALASLAISDIDTCNQLGHVGELEEVEDRGRITLKEGLFIYQTC